MARQVRVLIVDDDLDALYYVDDLLSELGYYPIKVTSADDAGEIVGAMCLDAVIAGFDQIVTAPRAALEQFARALEHTAVLIMGRPGLRPDGASSPLRSFLEHPPATDDLKAALEHCAAVPLRAGR
jgi:DNA-binding NtrC family response regulator